SKKLLRHQLALSKHRRNSVATSYCSVHHATYGVTSGKNCCPKYSDQSMIFSAEWILTDANIGNRINGTSRP
ncbi:hypothetical protein, partial [Shewanella sp.]|uniref:hypothetical protein n=1 Tax=Shewanella sp. TaxID=50422 RepID=UPI004048B767